MDLSRRRFLTSSAATSASFYLLRHALAAKVARADDDDDALPPSSPGLNYFTDDERETLASLCNLILPNAGSMGAVNYIENLLTAFDVDPPKIYAGGPFSGRTPFPKDGVPSNEFPKDSFKDFVPLNRYQEAAWKLRIYGPSAFANGYWNQGPLGDYVGLRDLFKEGLSKAVLRDGDEPSFDYTPSAFEDALKELVLEGCLSAPEYGGNFEQRGWKMAYFPGDSQPLGYSIYDAKQGLSVERADARVSAADPEDPDSLGFFSKAFLFFVTLFRGGRIF